MIKNINICFWFKELDFNPKEKIEDLSQQLKDLIDTPLMYNEEVVGKMLSMPRIQGLSRDKKYLFNMSLINALLSINVDKLDNDEVLLLVNEKTLLLYDILKEIYDLKIIYTSIKLEIVENGNPKSVTKIMHLDNREYEEISFKRSFTKGDYYIVYVSSSGREYNFNIKKDVYNTEQDLFERTLLVSLEEAKLKKEFFVSVVEINDRYAYNKDVNYLTTRENIRGMIMELQEILKKELYKEV